MNSYNVTKKPIQTLATGRSHSLNVHTITGDTTGPHVYIQASVHGSELQGNLVIRELINYAKTNILKGMITLVPMANPKASENKVSTFTQGRFHPETGDNWNRLYTDVSSQIDFEKIFSKSSHYQELVTLFKSEIKASLNKLYNENSSYGIKSEKILAYHLQDLASSADIVLDLHTGPVACEYLYTRSDHQELASDLGFPFVIQIPHEFDGAMDEASFMPWVVFEKECLKRNIAIDKPFEAYTLELCSEEVIDSKLAALQADRIINFLKLRGLFDGVTQTPCKHTHSASLESFKSYYSPRGGLIEFMKKPSEKVNAGDELYRLYDFSDNSLPFYSIKAENSGFIINHSPSAAVSQGICVYQVLEIKDLKVF